ncbi:hypothetical protein SAMN05192552_1006170 [Natrinema hispanicum]|uniref:Uncharacterized protein n=1 Tax=Natrinema hispanicum TaxID=392421 RepID=A0A1G6NW04_9EURY|nr:hypothetical protein SAMN05192552_1006170 [Natrinema hispanicum]
MTSRNAVASLTVVIEADTVDGQHPMRAILTVMRTTDRYFRLA